MAPAVLMRCRRDGARSSARRASACTDHVAFYPSLIERSTPFISRSAAGGDRPGTRRARCRGWASCPGVLVPLGVRKGLREGAPAWPVISKVRLEALDEILDAVVMILRARFLQSVGSGDATESP